MTERRRQLNAYERMGELFAGSRPGAWFFINVAMRIDRVLLPATRGRFSVGFPYRVGLLETIGARSGTSRRTPLVYVRDGARVVLVASKGGAPRNPAWYSNLKANPRVGFYGPRGVTGSYVAREVEGAERDRLWAEAVEYYGGFATYQGRADGRRIPVVVLERASTTSN